MEQLKLADGEVISYQPIRKNIKNLNLRILPEGLVLVSVPQSMSRARLETFLREKSDWILKNVEKQKQLVVLPSAPLYSEEELQRIILRLCECVYSHYRELGIGFPEIKFRKMKSQWGNCRPKQGILTFNKNLCYAPYECIEYVVWHEWTHFLVPNHSEQFYEELTRVCPDWKQLKKRLKEVNFL